MILVTVTHQRPCIAPLVLTLLPEGRACLDVCQTLLDHKLSLAKSDSTVCIPSLG
jgi:hypothetical protein